MVTATAAGGFVRNMYSEVENQIVYKTSKYGQPCVKRPYIQDMFLAFQTNGCLLLHESSVEINA